MALPEWEDIHLLARNSDWHREDIRAALEDHVYPTRADWRKLAAYLLLGAGSSFLVSGFVFFFAYNWEALTGAAKIIIAVGSFIVVTLTALFAPLPRLAVLTLHTAAVCLIGAVLAVLGQVYQTGANAFDFFAAWMVLTLPWLVAVGFAPLWLVGIAIANAAFITYSQQYGIAYSFLVAGTVLFAANGAAWLLLWLRFRRRHSFRWLLQLMAFWTVILATVNISAGSFDDRPDQLLLMVLLALLAYLGWGWLALRERSIYYLALVGGGSLITLAFLLMRWLGSENSLLSAGLIILLGISLLAFYLNRLNHRWHAS